ncbi:MAG: MBOAT family O-acyltransferase, partial [Thermotogota bacterium]
GETKEYDFLNYGVFVTFFPQLIAGPIVHHKEMMPQFTNHQNTIINYKNIAIGLFVFSVGLFKKVVIADTFAVWATTGFDKTEILTFFEAWAASLSYTFQLYFDFSGYTDMAIGAALLFNIKLPQNFNSPYKALNIRDFWRRWHMTLSRFLRDYVYIPMGGNRNGNFRTCKNIMATFILGGLWHGAGWTFVFWGFLHGLALVIHRLWNQAGLKLNSFSGWFITFNFVNIAWVFFRAEEWKDAVKVLKGMAGLNKIIIDDKYEKYLHFIKETGVVFGKVTKNIQSGSEPIGWIIISLILCSFFKNSYEMTFKFKIPPAAVALSSAVFVYAMMTSLVTSSEVFLYFNF